MQIILVPVDGSKGSDLALAKAREMADLQSSKVIILNVISNLMSNPYLLEHEHKLEINKVFSQQAKGTLDDALKFFEGYEGEIETEVRLGDPAQEIIDFAKEIKVDLVIMGNRGLNAFSRVMMGSVSNRVLNHVEASVLIVKE